MTGLSDFVIKDENGLSTFDLGKLKKLPIDEFAKRYIEEMDSFMKNHVGLPMCYPCSKPVKTADDLVRYFGLNLHRKCFLEEYENDIAENLAPRHREYYGLVKKFIETNAPTRS